MSTTSSSTMRSPAHRIRDERPPVLARLPDVSDDAARSPKSQPQAAAPAAEHRDPPPTSGREDGLSQMAAMLARPHGPAYPRRARSASPILPDSDPFQIPAESLHDRMAPVGRFLLVFAVAAAIGTALLQAGFGRSDAKPAAPPPADFQPSTTRAQLLSEPIGTLDPAASAPAQPAVKDLPSAVGPLGASSGAASESTVTTSNENRPMAPEKVAPIAPSPPALEAPPLPQVQTSDTQPAAANNAAPRPHEAGPPARSAAPAIARLPGYLLPSPQAPHDDAQPGLY